jgi:hypothetical protein
MLSFVVENLGKTSRHLYQTSTIKPCSWPFKSSVFFVTNQRIFQGNYQSCLQLRGPGIPFGERVEGWKSDQVAVPLCDHRIINLVNLGILEMLRNCLGRVAADQDAKFSR